MRSSKLRVLILVTLLTGLGVSGCHLLTDTEQVSKPVFSPPGGTYDSVVDVCITTATLGTTILYTTDGSDPNSNSLVYSGPIHVAQPTTLKAKAYRSGMQDSAIATANYTIDLPPPPPIQMIHVPGGTIYPTTGIYTDGLTVPSFYIGKKEITNAEWHAVMGSGGGNDYPHSNVSWFGAIEYCNRRSLQEGLTPCYSYLDYGTNPDDWPSGWNTNSDNAVNVSCDWNATGYRLPSEAEWEYAARGGLQTHGYTYSGSNDLSLVGWCWSNSGNFPHPVGQLAPNELGTYDMSGNLWECCWDIYSDSYRVIRGGYFSSVSSYCTVWVRNAVYPTVSDVSLGFRICRVYP